MSHKTLIGPFSQVLTMSQLKTKGALKDEELEVISSCGVLIEDGIVLHVADYQELKSSLGAGAYNDIVLNGKHVCMPGIIDAHTHICFGGSRARDYSMRNAGKTYLEIAKEGVAKFPSDAALYIRPMFWAENGFVAPDAESTQFCLCVHDAPLPDPTGFSLTVSPFRRPSAELAITQAKGCGCLRSNLVDAGLGQDLETNQIRIV